MGTLADDLLVDLAPPSLRFGLPSVQQYYEKSLKLPNSKFKFNFVSEETVLKLLKDLNENKAAGQHVSSNTRSVKTCYTH